MRRAALAALGVLAVVVAGIAIARHDSPARYRFAAIFDTAKGMVPGQQIKIAGAVVGRVERVGLAPGPKARIVFAVDPRFGPFHDDATCTILPEGLISENFVACNPGSPSRPALTARAGLPTVPQTQTSVPASLQDVLNVFAVPTDDRIRVLISELGIGLSGRGEDLNALLRRSNPALTQSTRLLKLVNRQRGRLAAAIAQTDRVVATLATRDQDLNNLVSRVATVTSTTAARHDDLAASVQRLPALLDAATPALRSLSRAATEGTPLLKSLRRSAPGLSQAMLSIPTFSQATAKALNGLSPVADTGRRAVRSATPVVRHLSTAASAARPFASMLDSLLQDTRDRGGIEGIVRWLYAIASASSAYDSTSHIAGFLLRVQPQCVASATAPGCTSTYSSPGQGTIPADDPSCGPQNSATWAPLTKCVSQLPSRRSKKHGIKPAGASRPLLPIGGQRPQGTPSIKPGSSSIAPAIQAADGVKSLLDYLLGP